VSLDTWSLVPDHVMLDASELAAATAPVAGRSCGTCTMCCKLFDVPEVASTAGKWCRHCSPGKGCRIYETRPQSCRSFFCGWMVSPTLGPEWKPERAKIILQFHVVGEIYWLTAYVDESYPTAWQRPELYERLKKFARANGAVGGTINLMVAVRIGRRHIVILPDRDVDLGIVADDEELAVTARDGLMDIGKVKRRQTDSAAIRNSFV
jgi:hypothetical protein